MVNQIADLSMTMSQANIMRELNVRMLRMQMDQMAQMQDAANNMLLCLSVNDVRVSADPSLGQHIDFFA